MTIPVSWKIPTGCVLNDISERGKTTQQHPRPPGVRTRRALTIVEADIWEKLIRKEKKSGSEHPNESKSGKEERATPNSYRLKKTTPKTTNDTGHHTLGTGIRLDTAKKQSGLSQHNQKWPGTEENKRRKTPTGEGGGGLHTMA